MRLGEARRIHDAAKLARQRDVLAVLASRPGPRVMLATVVASGALRIALGRPRASDALAAAVAIAIWPVQEWVAHRWLLHLRPRDVLGVRVDPLFARTHREHHAAPRDIDGTLLPSRVVVGAIPGAAAAWLAVFGVTPAAASAMLAYASMSLVYEWTHLWVHTSYKPRSAFAARLRRNHLLHHFRSEHHWFAFTLPLVDRWLGTDPDPDDVPRSPTAMRLHGDAGSRASSSARTHPGARL